MKWHSKKARNDRARQMGIDAPEGNHREKCDTCSRVQSVDMLMRVNGSYRCDGCWTKVRREQGIEALERMVSRVRTFADGTES